MLYWQCSVTVPDYRDIKMVFQKTGTAGTLQFGNYRLAVIGTAKIQDMKR